MIPRLIKVTMLKRPWEASLALDSCRKTNLLSIWGKPIQINIPTPILGNQ